MASKANAVLTRTANGHWLRDGVFFSPLELYTVVRQGGDGDLDFFDFLEGSWRGVVLPSTVTCNRSFADGVATRHHAFVRVYSLVAHTVAGG